MSDIAIIGAGSWGTALALTFARLGHSVRIWAFEQEVADDIRWHRENRMFLPGIQLPDSVVATTNFADVLERSQFVISVMPSHACRALYQQMLAYLKPDMILVSATKGLETDSLMRMSEVIRQVTRPRFEPRLVVLSGPSFALEVARGDPTAVAVASENLETARSIQRSFSCKTLRLYASSDVIGVEMGGAVKNVIAIAAGVIDGLGLGHNPKAALITRGLVEMTRLACACGARPETLAGLAGMGDLVLTCTGFLSRNHSVGVELGRGKKLGEILASMRTVAEGINTTAATLELARRHGVEMPITLQVQRILQNQISPQDAIRELMDRALKDE